MPDELLCVFSLILLSKTADFGQDWGAIEAGLAEQIDSSEVSLSEPVKACDSARLGAC